ncbi:phosphatidylglycerophosphatase A [Parvibaculum sp.]|uniref:phosphatidylglycerophosphatase A family protein n=1 Tax=Parvibaculum sp. TaxID=2024848 RepID=UPI003919A11F
MIGLTPLPAPLRFRDPTVIAATWFGAGLLRPAPGTWGTLAALPFAFVLQMSGGVSLLALSTILVFTVGLWASGAYCRAVGRDDASEVVIDEVAAMWLVLVAIPATAFDWLLAFLLFRLFDILKPWPIGLIERRVKGALGVMIDDIFAAIFAIISWFLLHALWTILT